MIDKGVMSGSLFSDAISYLTSTFALEDTGHSRGFGFITYDDEGGDKAISEIMSHQSHTICEKLSMVPLQLLFCLLKPLQRVLSS